MKTTPIRFFFIVFFAFYTCLSFSQDFAVVPRFPADKVTEGKDFAEYRGSL